MSLLERLMMNKPVKNLSVIVLGFGLLGLSGCSSKPVENWIGSTYIDEKRVVVYDVHPGYNFFSPGGINYNSFSPGGTKLVFLDNSGDTTKILYDDGNGRLGDGSNDYIQIYFKDGKIVKYNANYYVNEKGQKIFYDSDVGREIGRAVKSKFEENDRLYQEVKRIFRENFNKKI